MDGLSIAANVAGIASLAVQLAPHLYNYFADLKAAEEDVKACRDEVQMLIDVCGRLHEFLKTDAPEGDFDITQSVLVRTAVSCEGCLHELGRLLKSPVGWSRKMKWPIQKKRVEGIIERLRRHTQLFQFALNVEGCAILSQTPEDVTAILKLQIDASSKLHDITKGMKALELSAESYRNTARELAGILESISSFADPTEQLLKIQEGVGNITRRLTDDRDVEILDWLSSPQGHSRHYEVRSRRTPGTGKWIFDTPSVCDWMDEESTPKLLWFTGPPGCGKSTLLSLIIDELRLLQSTNNIAVAYYYCDYRSQGSDPLVTALGSILRSLVERLDNVPANLRDLYESSRREGRSPLPMELESLICGICTSFSGCFILVDAMDEFSIEDATQITKLTRILDSLVGAGVRVLVTSRTLPAPSSTAHRVIEKYTPAEADIRSYVSHALRSEETLVDLLDSELEATIMDTVVNQARGMFLLAVLHLQTVRGQVTRSGVRKALGRLSNDLGKAYDKTFQAITHQSESQRQLAINTLMWVSASYRPLNSLELRHALAVHEDDQDLDVDNIPPIKVVVRACCGLLAVDDMDDERADVRLVHHTLHQYLQTRQTGWFLRAHTKIALSCLTYLCFKSLNVSLVQLTVRCLELGHSPSSKDPWPLKRFAVDFWGFHAARAQPEAYVHQALRLLEDRARLKVLYPDNPKTKGLHVAATFGLTPIIARLISADHKIDAIDSKYRTALERACAHNHYESAMMLLKAKAKPDHWTMSCVTPLFHAVTNNNHRLAEALLRHGASVDHWCKDAWTALHKASDNGDVQMVKLLLRHRASVTETSARGLSALHRAAGRGHCDVMHLLIRQKAQIDLETKDGWTPLHGAASGGQTKAVELLLQSGADIHHKSLTGDTALHRACQNGSAGTVGLLISRGADVMIANLDGDLPMHIAAREGHGAAIDCLLEQSPAQLSHLNKNGWTPFHEAQLSGYHTTERLLKHQGCLLPGVNKSEKGDLEKAIRSDNADAIRDLLTTNNLDLEARDNMGRTLLHQALYTKAPRIARALLEAGADVHARSDLGDWQPIHYAAISGSAEAVRLCLDHGAHGDTCTQTGQTPLHHACRAGDTETVQLLLDQNVGTEVVDESGWTPIFTAAAAGHTTVVSLLLGGMNFANLSTLQATTAQRGHHGLVELIRDFRYSH